MRPHEFHLQAREAKVYLVEFVIIGAGCEQYVYDVTQPQERIPVASIQGH